MGAVTREKNLSIKRARRFDAQEVPRQQRSNCPRGDRVSPTQAFRDAPLVRHGARRDG
jgi:hypothetical protein